ncbi:MAG TPA: hypothetical protein VD860_17990 [Azospirillum sp.]|nr:hypothetical protein [Azospirillum sp.]
MFNILTVIISVALTAVMGAAGVFYVGSAFTSAGPKAAAIGVIQALSQIQGAWTLYSSDGNSTTLGAVGTTVPTMTGTTSQTDLIYTNYLGAVPTAPSVAATWGTGGSLLPATYALDLTDPTNLLTGLTQNSTFAKGGVFIVMASTAASQCAEIARAGGQITGSTAPSVGTLAAFNTAFTGYKFGCVRITTATAFSFNNVVGVAGDNNKYVAYYKF